MVAPIPLAEGTEEQIYNYLHHRSAKALGPEAPRRAAGLPADHRRVHVGWATVPPAHFLPACSANRHGWKARGYGPGPGETWRDLRREDYVARSPHQHPGRQQRPCHLPQELGRAAPTGRDGTGFALSRNAVEGGTCRQFAIGRAARRPARNIYGRLILPLGSATRRSRVLGLASAGGLAPGRGAIAKQNRLRAPGAKLDAADPSRRTRSPARQASPKRTAALKALIRVGQGNGQCNVPRFSAMTGKPFVNSGCVGIGCLPGETMNQWRVFLDVCCRVRHSGRRA